MSKIIYKNYLIESYEETRLVGGPYENNEERIYRETGNILYTIKPTLRSLPGPGHVGRTIDSIKKAKLLIDRLINRKRTKNLQTKHHKAIKQFSKLKKVLRNLEEELRTLGAEHHEPNIYGDYT